MNIMQATIKAPYWLYSRLFFTDDWILPSGGELRIYKGEDTTPINRTLRREYMKPMDFYGKSFTIVYDPKSSVPDQQPLINFEGIE